eukprot:scaffold694_cov338-Pavlova_lutheri.AAC.35
MCGQLTSTDSPQREKRVHDYTRSGRARSLFRNTGVMSRRGHTFEGGQSVEPRREVIHATVGGSWVTTLGPSNRAR